MTANPAPLYRDTTRQIMPGDLVAPIRTPATFGYLFEVTRVELTTGGWVIRGDGGQALEPDELRPVGLGGCEVTIELTEQQIWRLHLQVRTHDGTTAGRDELAEVGMVVYRNIPQAQLEILDRATASQARR